MFAQHTFANGLTLLAELMDHVRSAALNISSFRPAAFTIRTLNSALGSIHAPT